MVRRRVVAIGLGSTNEPISERGIIETMKARLDVLPGLPVPFGDDVSAIQLDGKLVAVLKTDMLVGATDVPRGMSFWQAARKAVVMNVSDFAAKGVEPKAALVSLGLPGCLRKEDVEAIASGLNAGAREYGLYVIGGDTSETSDTIIAIMLFGTANKDKLMLRNGARIGDIVAVSGFFGKSAAGLCVLQKGCKLSEDSSDMLMNSVYMPCARLKEGMALAGSGAVSASIDSSDGLAWSLHELSRMSDVGFILDFVPVADEVSKFAEINKLNALDLALYGGEEYELVVTVRPELWVTAVSAVEDVGGKLLPIGKVVQDKQTILKLEGKKRVVEARGWEHFRSRI